MDQLKKDLHWFEKLESKTGKPRAEGDTSEMKVTPVNLQKFMEDAGKWIDDVSYHLGVPERKDWGWSALRSVMHALRDRMPVEEAFQLSAQLPMLIRGLFFESYHYSPVPAKFHWKEMLKRIENEMNPGIDIPVEKVFSAVLQVLYDNISEGEMNDVYATLPKDIRHFWDENRK